MIRFEHPDYLYALAALPLLLLLWLLGRMVQHRRLARAGTAALVSRQLLGRIAGRSFWRMLLLSLALGLGILGIANPQYNGKKTSFERRGVDVIVALDVSRSMLASDVSPDRLSRAKLSIQLLLDQLQAHRAGLVLFAGRAYLQAPVTTDYSAVRMMLQSAGPDAISRQGTALAEAIRQSTAAFSQQEKKYKLLVLLTDGEDHEPDALKAAADAAREGVVIYTVGIGSPSGSTIRDPQTGETKKDAEGETVVSRLNEEPLRQIAATGHGRYLPLGNPAQLAAELAAAADGMETKALGTADFTEYQSGFQWLLLPAFVLLLLESVLPGARRIHKKRVA